MQQRKAHRFSFDPEKIDEIKNKVLAWIHSSGTFLYLDSHGYQDPYGRYEMLAACAPVRWIKGSQGLNELRSASPDWYFGHLAYDFKNELFKGLTSRHKGKAPTFEDLAFFVPETVCFIPRGACALVIESFKDPENILSEILHTPVPVEGDLPNLTFKRCQQQPEYEAALQQVLAHIAAGNCYELNYCSEAVANAAGLDPCSVYRALKRKAPMPFSAYYRHEDAYMMGASPERYFCKSQSKLIAQPIKGTAPRGANKAADQSAIDRLRKDPKEQAENVMIVDLMRNDLARVCVPGTVEVAELFGIYTFPTVHQLISTVVGTLRPTITVAEILEKTFPMGSMTGAPKKRVLEITDELEVSRRGLYAGTTGYLSPDGDADFNVVIRSLFYDADSGRLSYHSGGAITRQSVPEQEWNELLLKGCALEALFGS